MCIYPYWHTSFFFSFLPLASMWCLIRHTPQQQPHPAAINLPDILTMPAKRMSVRMDTSEDQASYKRADKDTQYQDVQLRTVVSSSS